MSVGAICPLCEQDQTQLWAEDSGRVYRRCQLCDLVFVPEPFHLGAEDEKQRYQQHQNNEQDSRYRAFLSKLTDPLMTSLERGAQGLDFGCGPGPTLSVMMSEQGYDMAIFDPYFANDRAVLTKSYDFISCTEAIEHFSNPAKEWRRFLSLLKPGGILAIMTRFLEPSTDFATWYYKKDPTHICFFSRQCFEWLAERDEMNVTFHGDSVAIFLLK